jgi:GH15 family glucan-1,4-alpha-glucosidase
MPHIDSSTVFAALLDDQKGGFFKIQPVDKFESKQEYLKDTNILSCTFKTKTGQAELIDSMPITTNELFQKKEHAIHRCLKVTSGRMDFKLEFSPRPQYASGVPRIVKQADTFNVKFKDKIFMLIMNIKKYELRENSVSKVVVYFTIKENEDAHFDFVYGDEINNDRASCSLQQTERFWKQWLHSCVGERCTFFGEYTDMINRSLLVLRLLTFQPTGGIVAAATTSLPESLGGQRNWDYRFVWIRDASFTLKAFFNLGHIAEADSFINWLQDTYQKHGSKNLQIMYSLEGKSRLTENELVHLKGYKNSKPVRVGNNAYNQRQWDIYGEVMDSALRLSDYTGKIDEDMWPFFRDICDLASKNWRRPDEGIWEVRNGRFHFVYSKVMCWVALDRGIKIARRYGFDAPIQLWQRIREEIRQDILENGYDKDMNSFIQYYGSKNLDASLLLLPLLDFLPIDDNRIQNTIRACQKNLMRQGFLLRYRAEDGLKGEEGAFILCNFWLIECLALSGKTDEAKELLDRTLKAANHLGLFSEEYDYSRNLMLGNFPQAFSHIGFINAAIAVFRTKTKKLEDKTSLPLLKRMNKLIPLKIVLNKTKKKYSETTEEISAQLKVTLSQLQGAFFDVQDGKVNYRTMKKSKGYKDYIELAGKLNSFDVFSLKTDEEKKAFWINIYNILIIHGVIELDIESSVKDVFNFFRRIGYLIGGCFFTPDDIEHGILRSNRPHPISRLRQFSWFDKRKALSLKRLDPRIHFALVCASNSCPPIEFYEPREIDHQLDIAGKSFVNRKGMFLDKKENNLVLSQIFKWYVSDFGGTIDELLKFVIKFTNNETKDYISKNKDKLKIKYLPYDWNLNSSL